MSEGNDSVTIYYRDGDGIRSSVFAGRDINVAILDAALVVKCGDAVIQVYAPGEWTQFGCSGDWFEAGHGRIYHGDVAPGGADLMRGECCAHAAVEG